MKLPAFMLVNKQGKKRSIWNNYKVILGPKFGRVVLDG